MADAAVIYEVTLEVERGILSEFDAWLAEHIQAMLRLTGFVDAKLLHPAAATADGPVIRIVQYTLINQAALDQYLETQATRMRDDGTARFGTRFRASRRVFPAAESATKPATLQCLNCGTPLAGKYCVECGQPNHTYIAPLWETIEEFFGNHFGLDTKFFHSIIPLLASPGFLTREYCRGRRERYIKPLRLYLFSSILFFFCAVWLIPISSVVGSASANSKTAAQHEQARKQIQETLATLEKDPSLSTEQKARIAAAIHPDKIAPNGKTPAPDETTPADNGGKQNFAARFVKKLQRINTHRQEFVKTLLFHVVPKLMFIFLPLVALLLKLFYVRHRQLYMEHLIFTLHCHSLFFIVLLTGVIIDALARYFAWPATVMGTVSTFLDWYLAVYLVLALRNFYQQSWVKTLVKFCLLFVCYWILIVLGLIGALVVTVVEA